MVSTDSSVCYREFIRYVLIHFHDYCQQTLQLRQTTTPKEEIQTQLLLRTSRSCKEEMVVMVVTESLGLVVFQVGMGRMERREWKESPEHRACLDPGVGEPLTSGGAGPLAPM